MVPPDWLVTTPFGFQQNAVALDAAGLDGPGIVHGAGVHAAIGADDGSALVPMFWL